MSGIVNETTNESNLINQTMRELGKHGAVYRTNSGSVKLDNGKRFRALPAGFSDIMFIRPDGIACFIEMKVKSNKPTDKQLEFIDKMKRHNCLAGVAYSVEEAMEICGLEMDIELDALL